jgi:hypothetical protein
MYNPLPTPENPWESISMDMSSLPSTKQVNDCIFFYCGSLFQDGDYESMQE